MNDLPDPRAATTSARRPRRTWDELAAACRMLAAILVGLAMTSMAPAQDTLPAEVSAPQSIESEGPEAEPTSASDKREEAQRRRNVASILVILLIGVGLIGVLMIAAALMWGAKLRRLVRESATEATRQDELWYLKTPPPPDAGGSLHSPSLAGDQPPAPATTDGDPTTNGETNS